MSEHDEQCAVVKWFGYQYPKFRECLFAIPNGAVLCDLTKEKRMYRMSYLIKEGFKDGVSDLLLALPRGGYAGLWLEMKDRGKTQAALTRRQGEHLALMRGVGYFTDWAAGFAQAHAIIDNYMKLKLFEGFEHGIES